ncbi:hypothetical protein XI03_12340 [Bradyrhizobium sp. CCBAU 65884]|nr:hypothetical protein [Bradyrhizobium sp. CCBAU 65884]
MTLAASLAHGAEQEGMKRTLTLPHSIGPGAIAWLEVQIGPLAPGQRVRVTTRTGELLGAISPFGRAERQSPGTYSLPVPPDVIHDDALSVIVTITEANMPPRAPTPTEVQNLKLLAPGSAK